MAKDYDIFAQAGLCGGDALVERIIGDQQIGVEIAAHSGLDFGRAHGCRRFGAD